LKLLLSICANFLALPLIVTARAQTETAIEQKPIAAALQSFVDHQVLAGAVVLVASREKVLDLEAVGYADAAAKKPMSADALFWIASMSKPIAATAMMMLIDEGRVHLDDPVDQYLPEFKDVMVADKNDKKAAPRKPSRPILVRHLLSLTSGMQFGSEKKANELLDVGTLAERVRSYAKMTLDFDPGTNYQYSNASLNTAVRIIEVVGGIPYEEFLDQRLFQPLGMNDTTFWPNEEQLTRLAKSYKGNADKSGIEETPIDQLTYPLNDRRRQPVPAGGLFSTAADYARFARMILNGGELDGKRYLSTSAVQQMTVKQTPASVEHGYGFGFQTAGPTFGHPGHYGTSVSIHSDRDLILIFMVQNAGWRNEEGRKIGPAFGSAALKAFGKVK